LGAGLPAGGSATPSPIPGLAFPADQVARAATMTRDALQNLAQAYTPMLQAAGAPGLLGQWAAALPQFLGAGANPAASAGAMPGAQNLFAPWAAAMPFLGSMPTAPAPAATPSPMPSMFNPWAAAMAMFPGAQAEREEAGKAAAAALEKPGAWIAMLPFTAGAQALTGAASPAMANFGMLPFQTMQNAWRDFGAQMAGATPQTYGTSFDRTFGALTDSLGFGPLRKLQSAWQDLLAASLAQNQSRASYAMLVQSAFAEGLEGLWKRLADMAEKGERIDSVLALLRLWALCTEEAVHRLLQSESGLAATAQLSRAGLTYRRKTQHLARIIADGLDMATRRDLDEAFREIQDLKREMRKLRRSAAPGKARRNDTRRTET
jgi:hypothetical protein